MKGDPSINQHLNAVLRELLTSINQYFLHARMLDDWGMEGLGQKDYQRSIKAMKQSDSMISRVLFLEGLPNLQDLGKLLIGEDVAEILKNNLTMDMLVRTTLVSAVDACEKAHDFVSREHLEAILEDLEEHIDWLEAQLDLLDKVGSQNYIQSAMGE